MRAMLTVVVAAMVAGACVHQAAPSGNHNLITEAEIDGTNAQTAYDVVARLRGDFLRNRGKTSILLPKNEDKPAVFLNDTEYGPVESMRNVRASVVAVFQFYSGVDAVARL